MEVPRNIPVNNEVSYRFIGEREIEWSSKGKTLIKLACNKDGRDLTISFDETFMPNIRDYMCENNEDGLPKSTLVDGSKDKRDFLNFHIEPNNNPNLQWRDWITTINNLIESGE